jgi:hypothetical protein
VSARSPSAARPADARVSSDLLHGLEVPDEVTLDPSVGPLVRLSSRTIRWISLADSGSATGVQGTATQVRSRWRL